MIEENILNLIEIGDGLDEIEIYHNHKFVLFCKYMKILNLRKFKQPWIHIILQIVFYLQILLMANITYPETSSDKLFYLLKYIYKIFLPQTSINSSLSYLSLFFLFLFVLLLIILLSFIIVLSIKYDEKNIKEKKLSCSSLICKISFTLNIIFLIVFNYLITPIIEFSLMSLNCNNDYHRFLNKKCFTDNYHLFIMILSFIILIFYFALSIIFALFYTEINDVGGPSIVSRVKTYYELYILILKNILSILHYLFSFHFPKKLYLNLIYKIIITLVSLTNSYYVRKNVYYYLNEMNIILRMCSFCLLWFDILDIFKLIITLDDITTFVIVGWVIIFLIISLKDIYENRYYIFTFNLSKKITNIDIEKLINILNKFYTKKNSKYQVLLSGFINKIEEFISNDKSISLEYNNYLNSSYLYKIIGNNDTLKLYSLIIIIYKYYIKNNSKNSIYIGINFCYFIIKKMKNFTLFFYYCSKLEPKSYMNIYYKYLLVEEVKDQYIQEMKTNSNILKHTEYSTVILYNLYRFLFKIKITDAITCQIEYFDNIQNMANAFKNIPNLIEIGKNIIKIRNQIKSIINKILVLNPNNVQICTDYLLYISNILKDDILLKAENKNFINHKKKTYNFSMFNEEISSVMLVQGVNDCGKILYKTPNFNKIFTYESNDSLSFSIYDLIPNCIAEFHQDLIENSIEYSNISYIFNKEKEIQLKAKNNTYITAIIILKSLPNMTYGLFFIVYLKKIIKQHEKLIILLNKNFEIDGFTRNITMSQNSLTELNKKNYEMTSSIIGLHITAIIPEIFALLKFKDNEFYFTMENKEIKSELFPLLPWKELVEHINKMLNKMKGILKKENKDIKTTNILNNYMIYENENIFLYNKLLEIIKSRCVKSYNICFKIEKRSFINDKYKYYKIYIKDDISIFEKIQSDKLNDINETKLNSENSDFRKASAIYSSNFKVKSKEKQIKLRTSLKAFHKKLKIKNSESNQKNLKLDGNGNNSNQHLLNTEEKKFESRKNKNSNNSDDIDNIKILKFFDIKQRILDQKVRMKYDIILLSLCLLSLILMIFLIIYDNSYSKNITSHIRNYLQENVFFNYTKIAVMRIYIVMMFKEFFNKGIFNNTIYSDSNENYVSLLSSTIDNLSDKLKSFETYHLEIRQILDQKTLHTVTTIENINDIYFNVTYKQILNILVYYTLKNQFFVLYNENKINLMGDQSETMAKNLIDSCIIFMNNILQGIKNEDKDKVTSKKFKLISPIFIIIVCIQGIIIILLLLTFNIIYLIEINFVIKIISFNSIEFKDYLISLNEIKKKLKLTEEDDEQKENEDFEIDNYSEKESEEENENKHSNENNNKNKNLIKHNVFIKEIENKNLANINNIPNYKHKKFFEKKDRIKRQKQQLLIQKRKKKSIYYFLLKNIEYIIKILILFLLCFSYFISSNLIKNNIKKNCIEYDIVVYAIENVVKDVYDKYVLVLREIQKYFEDKNYNIKIPEFSDLEINTFGSTITNMISKADSYIERHANQLFYGDACLSLFENYKESYELCIDFWDQILTKGLEQTIAKVRSIMPTIRDILISLNNKDITLTEVLDQKNVIYKMGRFLGLYLCNAYWKSKEIFNYLKQYYLKSNTITFRFVLYFYCIGCVLLYIIIIYYVTFITKILKELLNFIAIFPYKFIMDDKDLFKDITKLDDSIV